MTVTLIEIDKSEIVADRRELVARLGSESELVSSLFSSSQEEINRVITPRVAFLRLPIAREGAAIRIGEIMTESEALKRTLRGYSEAVIFAVTLGTELDRVIRSVSIVSKRRGFILDSIASAYAEALCDIAEGKIFDTLGSVTLGKRFSPGYSDLPLSVNREILSMLCADKNIGIYLLDSALMSPRKSVTAIIGVKENENEA